MDNSLDIAAEQYIDLLLRKQETVTSLNSSEQYNFPLQPHIEKNSQRPSAKSKNSTAVSDQLSSKRPIGSSKKSNGLCRQRVPSKENRAPHNKSFRMSTKSSALKVVKRPQNPNCSFRTSIREGSVGPWNFESFKKGCDNSIIRTSQLKAYDSYINESLAELMTGSESRMDSAMRFTKNSMSSLRRDIPTAKCNNTFVDRKALANKIKENMKQKEGKSPEVSDCSFSAKNCIEKDKASFLEKGAQELKESLVVPEKDNSSGCKKLTDISRISKVEPSAFIENISLIEPLKEMEPKSESSMNNYNDGIDEYSSIECTEGNVESHLHEPHNTQSLRHKCGESTLCSYDDVALVRNEEKINEYLEKLTKIENKYRKMFARLKKDKIFNMQLLVKRCLDENELQYLTNRGGSREIVNKCQEMIEEYKRTKKLLKEQQLMENNELLAEYRQFHKLLHKVE